MKKLLIFFAACALATLNAARIVDINTYTNKDYTDVVFSLSAPYEPDVTMSNIDLKRFILLKGLHFNKEKQIGKASKRYEYIKIYPRTKAVLIEIREKKDRLDFKILGSKDKYSIKLRILDQKPVQLASPPKEQMLASDIPDLQDEYLIAFAFVAFFILIWILAKIFGNKDDIVEDPYTVKVEIQKKIDNQNKIIKVSFAKTNYIMLIGQNNILLDKYTDSPKTYDDVIKAASK